MSSQDPNNNESNNKEDKVQIKNEWMIRRCAIYDEEYSDCTSIKGRLHQYFIHGKTIDCSQWKADSNNCYKWEQNQDVNAANALIQSEKQRRKDRLLPHYTNSVWKKRKSPPENWNHPLPEYLEKSYENSYLDLKNKEMKGEIPPSIDFNYRCSIM